MSSIELSQKIIEKAVEQIGIDEIAKLISSEVLNGIRKGVEESLKDIQFGDFIYDIISDDKVTNQIRKMIIDGLKGGGSK